MKGKYLFLVGLFFVVFGIFVEFDLGHVLRKKLSTNIDKTLTSTESLETESLESENIPTFLVIPKIKVSSFVYQNTNKESLKRGLGIWRGKTSESLACWIAGHRSLSFFWRLPELKIGDSIVAILRNGKRQVFLVSGIRIIRPEDQMAAIKISLMAKGGLVLFTCHPPFIANKRWVVIAKIKEE